jgi:hypothetical protein
MLFSDGRNGTGQAGTSFCWREKESSGHHFVHSCTSRGKGFHRIGFKGLKPNTSLLVVNKQYSI